MLSTPVGTPASMRELGDRQRAERRLRRGLDHDGAAGRERGRHLPRDHGDREIPGRDRGDDADRLLDGDDSAWTATVVGMVRP